MAHHRPGARNKKTTCNGSEEESDSEYSDYYDSYNDSDVMELPIEDDSYE